MTDIKQHEEDISQNLIHKAEMLQNRPNRRWHSNFGMIASLGGVIIMPILLCLWGGTYLDVHYPQHFSWRLSGIFLGFIWGLTNAYLWIKTENRKIEDLNTVKESKNE